MQNGNIHIYVRIFTLINGLLVQLVYCITLSHVMLSLLVQFCQLAVYSGSKNCPNVCLFCKDIHITQC